MTDDIRQKWQHIGDGVYILFDGYGFLLHANSHDNPTDRIYLVPSVLAGIVGWAEFCTKPPGAGGEGEG